MAVAIKITREELDSAGLRQAAEEGLAGLTGRHGDVEPKRLLSPEQEAEVAEWVRRGPDLAVHSVVRWRPADLARAIEARFGVVLAERSISTVLRRLGFRRVVPRPRRRSSARARPQQDAGALVAG
jgi:transposase